MPTTATTTTTQTLTAARTGIGCAPAPHCTALTVALDAAQTRLDAALGDLRALVATGELCADTARDLEREYVTQYLRRVTELERRGALACTPDEWLHYVTTAACRETAAERRHRARRRRASRHCLVVAPGRITDPMIATLIDGEPDVETDEIRAELAAASLL